MRVDNAVLQLQPKLLINSNDDNNTDNNNNNNNNNNKLRFVWHETVHKLAKVPSFVYCLKENS